LALTGDTSEQDFWIGYGSGANGKSTLLNTVLRVLGDYGATTAFSTFDADNRNQYGNDLAALKGKRLVVAIEAEKERFIAESRVKSITGGDAISCRFLYGEFFEYRPQFKVWLAVNHKPNIRGTDRGIWRRVKLVPFARNFEDNEDKTLAAKLCGELPGILNWLLAGLKDWRKQGIAEPAAVKDATKEYKEEMDTLGQWIEETCEVHADRSQSSPVSTGATDLHRAYRAWAEDRGERYPLSLNSFARRLGERGFAKTRKERGVVYHGLTLTETRRSIRGQGG
jgi:putative DNA primase/helicase